MTERAKTPEAGFTLVETLVALLVLSMVSVAGGSLLLRANDAGKQVREREAALREIDIAQAFIRNDLAALTARGWSPPESGQGLQTLAGGETNRTDALMSFVRSGWLNPAGQAPRSDLQAVRYTLSDEGELVREAWLRPDPAPSTPMVRRVLLENVADVRLGFWRGSERSAYWEGTPVPPADVLPEAIDVEITFKDGRALTITARSNVS
ncbi:type II secretion system minor pseudopilin GspJ [Henriciella aquimarina]|uniref:type II secretion system minor pseudopilin GspJ n=1 Tax=Henriciella aquimarina TaxID=545261 RepID=UPI0009FC1586|nr:type II secretion system minor pseudopilin GspJ [Henriciella aquimarina]